MKQFKIKDNCLKKKEDFYMVSGLVEQVADKTLQQLECEGIFIFPGGCESFGRHNKGSNGIAKRK